MIKNQFKWKWFWRQAIIVMQSDILILVNQTVKWPFNDIAMLPWDLSAFTNLLSLLQCSLGTWLSPVPLGLEGLSPVPFELEELSPFPLQGYPWRRGPRVSLPEDTGRVVGEGTLVYVSNVGLNKNRNKTQKMKRHDFYFVFLLKTHSSFFNNCEWQLQIGLISFLHCWSLIFRTLKDNVNFRPIKQTRHWRKHERKCLNLPTYFHPPLPDSRLLLKSPSNDLKLEIYPQDQLFRKKRILTPFVMPMM
jgi:hypothetical protein